MANKKPLTNTNGIIREFSNGDSIAVKFGGTGLNTLPKDSIVVGADSEHVKTIKFNFDATTPPSPTDDINSNYAVGSKWYDIVNHIEYTCLDNTIGNAVWKAQTQVSQGYQGNQGNQGNQGADGVGVQGYQGNQGNQGANGVGTQGYQGNQGANGVGVQGYQGNQGNQGATPSTANLVSNVSDSYQVTSIQVVTALPAVGDRVTGRLYFVLSA